MHNLYKLVVHSMMLLQRENNGNKDEDTSALSSLEKMPSNDGPSGKGEKGRGCCRSPPLPA